MSTRKPILKTAECVEIFVERSNERIKLEMVHPGPLEEDMRGRTRSALLTKDGARKLAERLNELAAFRNYGPY